MTKAPELSPAEYHQRLEALEAENAELRARLEPDASTPLRERIDRAAAQPSAVLEIREIYAMAPQAMALYDRELRFIRINERLAEINGLTVEDHIGRKVSEVLPDIGDFIEDKLGRVRDTGQAILGYELSGTTPAAPTVQRIWEADWYPVKVGDEVVAVGASVRDVTLERELQQDLRNAMRELQHRVKNILANVSALIAQAQRSERPANETLSILSARIKSLANTHEVLTSRNWRETQLSTVLRAELSDVYGEERVSLDGPAAPLNARATLSFAMAFHELATNAAKYGALGPAGGRVDVSWSLSSEPDPELLVSWVESGGPSVAVPTSGGFGTSLIDHSIKRTLGGSIERTFDPTGLQCSMRVLVSRLGREDEIDAAREPAIADPFS